MLSKEYRICMPLTVEEYRIGQLYMIARHSLEQSHGSGDGVEVVQNRECTEDEEDFSEETKKFLHNRDKHDNGQFTEKRVHLSSRLPYWLQAICPRVFYVIEKSWNYYPYTITEYTCSFIPKFRIEIFTKFEDNEGTTENSFNVPSDKLSQLIVDHIDIAFDELNPKHYKENEDPKFFKSEKTNRGPLMEGWRKTDKPIMCSYKMVNASFEVWGFQTKVEDFIHKCIRDVLLLGHRQAFAWIDEWYNMSMTDVRDYERQIQEETNLKVKLSCSSDLKTDQVIEKSLEATPEPVLAEID